jgi:uncharacterized protein YigA (DUF484 family)
MTGLTSPAISSSDNARDRQAQAAAMPFPSTGNEPGPLDAEPSEFQREPENSQLLQSFDMIFRLHQRSEEIRRSLDEIERILLTSRTVAGLVERVTRSLAKNLDLNAVRMLFREDHPMVSAFEFDAPENMGTIPQPLMENEHLFHSEPYVVDYPAGDLGQSLFGAAAPLLASAAVANLYTDTEDVGLLCLGSADPQRYCGGMNMELIASLADKISLGLYNAWDHEVRARQALMGDVDGIYSESFLKEYLSKEFSRSWRTFRPFSLMALSWGFPFAVGAERAHDLMSVIRSNLRCADMVAEGETVDLWVLLPDTDPDGARVAAERIVGTATESSSASTRIYVGITAFSREAVAAGKLMSQAKLALAAAMENDQDDTIAVQPVALG